MGGKQRTDRVMVKTGRGVGGEDRKWMRERSWRQVTEGDEGEGKGRKRRELLCLGG